MSFNWQKYYDLWNKSDEYTDDEFKFLKSYIKNKNFKVRYGFYNKVSSQKKQIAVILDTNPNQIRRTGVENNWEVIHTRDITDKEIEQYINFHFRNSFKRFLVFYYNNVNKLVYDDKRLNAITPDKFIDECSKRGYTGTYQLKVEFA